MSCFKIIPTILANLVSRWIFYFESDTYFSSVFQYLPGIHRILCLGILFSYKDFLEDFYLQAIYTVLQWFLTNL